MSVTQCEFSSDLFQGFRCFVELQACESLEDIITFARQSLRRAFREEHLIVLEDKAFRTPFHIHNRTWDDIVRNPEQTVWICDHVEPNWK